jgi:hypothetical protein
MAWPHPPDYNEAVQNPRLCFADPELQQGQPVLNALGLPWPRSGNSADVYKIIGRDGQAWAVKCFTREVRGLRERYQAISAYLRKQPSPFMVDFRYEEPGIKVNGQWFPVLKMRWVDGLMLNELAREYADKPVILDRLADMWVRLSQEMRHARLIHGDLQHGNVLLVPTGASGTLRLRLVDYDGMVVPGLADHPPDEVGHPNYQHPQRLSHGNPQTDLDRFAHLVIYSALRCLVVGGRELLERHDNSDNLLFREHDFRAPAESKIFHELWDTKHPVARTLVGYLVLAATGPLEEVPKLSHLVKRGQLRFLSSAEEKQVEELLASPAPSELAVPPAEAVGENHNSADAVPSLVAALSAADARVREDAADSLAALGARARAAVPALRAALNDRDVHVRHSAAQALWAIDPLP